MFWKIPRRLLDDHQQRHKRQSARGRRIRRWASIGGVSLALVSLAVPSSDVAAAGTSARTLLAKWSAGSESSVVQESNSAVTYRGRWQSASHSDYLGGKARATKVRGAKASLGFTGTAIAWVGPVGPTRGKARVYIDGHLVKTINTWASSFRASRVLFKRTWDNKGSHRITIIANGTARHPTVALDAFLVRQKGARLTFAAECNGSSLHRKFHAPYGPGDPGPTLDSDFMGDLRQVSVANGRCTITARRMTTPSGRPFGSAAIATKDTWSQAYGTWVARIRYPAGQGVWPAFWMLKAGSAATPPEIDVVEAYPAPPGAGGGSGVDTVVSTLHYVGGKHWVVYDANRDMTKDFHVYRMVWTPNRLVFSVDGKVTGRITENVPSHPMYPILSLGIGTNLYRADATTPSPLKMDIDYVRVYAP